MYVFAMAMAIGLMVMLAAHVVTHHIAELDNYPFHTLVLFGIGGAWLADFNLWAEWGLSVREEWIGVVLTGVALAGSAHFWNQFLGLMSSMQRKVSDEAMTLEKEHHLKAA